MISRIGKLSRVKLYRRQNRFYEKAYDTGVTPWSPDGKPSAPVAKAIGRIAKTLKHGTALDLGCGEGRHSHYLAGKGFKVIGLDIQMKALAKAALGNRSNPLFVRADLFHPPLRERSFDIVVDYGIFHHIRRRDTGHYLALIEPLLKPGGWLLLSCFSTNFAHEGGKRYKRGYVVHNDHYDRFSTKAELKRIFGARFDIESIEEDPGNFWNSTMRLK